MDSLDLLLTRQSAIRLQEPAPTEQELGICLKAAMRVPDHGRLRPWRFLVVRDQARRELGQILAAALHAREPDAADSVLQKESEKFLRAPLMVVVAARVQTDLAKIPPIEQAFAVAAATQNLLLALHAMGYSGAWRTGSAAYDDHVKQALGLTPPDHIVGFIYIGTPAEAPRPSPELDPTHYVAEWTDGAGFKS